MNPQISDQVAAVYGAARRCYRAQFNNATVQQLPPLEAESQHLFEQLKSRLEGSALSLDELLKAWAKMHGMAAKERAGRLPVVADFLETRMLVRAYQEVLCVHLGHAHTRALSKKVGVRFQQMRLAHDAAEAQEAASKAA